jgi:hypothetical protein
VNGLQRMKKKVVGHKREAPRRRSMGTVDLLRVTWMVPESLLCFVWFSPSNAVYNVLPRQTGMVCSF